MKPIDGDLWRSVPLSFTADYKFSKTLRFFLCCFASLTYLSSLINWQFKLNIEQYADELLSINSSRRASAMWATDTRHSAIHIRLSATLRTYKSLYNMDLRSECDSRRAYSRTTQQDELCVTCFLSRVAQAYMANNSHCDMRYSLPANTGLVSRAWHILQTWRIVLTTAFH